MTVNEIMGAISTVGFPIVMCGVLIWYMLRTESYHRQETEKYTEAINNNTLAITRLVDKLEGKV